MRDCASRSIDPVVDRAQVVGQGPRRSPDSLFSQHLIDGYSVHDAAVNIGGRLAFVGDRA